MKTISVVIPTKNAGKEFELTLEMIRKQKIDMEIEVIVIDSGSTDETIGYCKKFNVNVHTILPSEFSHGGTRNFGISLAKGEFVVLLVQDAIPVDENWLSSIVQNFEVDSQVAGVYSKQIPRNDCNIFTKHALEKWITFGNIRVEQYIKDYSEYQKMSPLEKQLLVTFDNVSSCIRKSVWENIQFNKVPFGEDIEWSKRVVESGYKIIYEPSSAVIHSHNRSIWYETKRTYVCHRTLKELFSTHLVPSLIHALRNLQIDVKQRINIVRKSKVNNKIPFEWLLKAVLLSIGMQAGMYLGGKSETNQGAIFSKLDKFLSKGV